MTTPLLGAISAVAFFLAAFQTGETNVPARSSAGQGEAQGPAAEVSGLVTTTGPDPRPLNGATISVATVIAPFETRSTTTGSDGRFMFRGLQPSRYRVRVSKPAYLTVDYGADVFGEEGMPINLIAGSRVTDLVVRLAKGAVLSGVVWDPDGTPAGAVVVTASRGTGTPVEGWTNHRGEYRLYGLPPGDYVVSAKPSTSQTRHLYPAVVRSSAEVDEILAGLRRAARDGRGFGVPAGVPAAPRRGSAAAPSVDGYVDVYYPGVTDRRLAAVVTLGEGESVGGLNFGLAFTGSSRIRGRVVDADGTVPGPVFVSAAPVHTGRGVAPRATHRTTAPQGTFELANVPPGRYLITVTTGRSANVHRRPAVPEGGGEIQSWAEAEVEVNGSDTADLTLTLQPAMTLSGRMRIETEPAPGRGGPAGLVVDLVSLGALPGETPAASADVQVDGTFRLLGIGPGSYRVGVSSASASGSDLWLRSATVEGRELLDAPLAFGASSGSIADVVLTLSTRRNVLSGSLAMEPGTSVGGLHVAVFPVDSSLWTSPRRLRFTRPATDGSFEFRDLPAGEYFLAATRGRPTDDEWSRAEFLQELASAALRVQIRDGEHTVQDFLVDRRR
jgi:hypothetical protein